MEYTKNRVPFLNGNNYALWSGRMQFHLLVEGYKLWEIVDKGFTSTHDEQGDSKVKEEKLQILREKFEQLKMREDKDVAAYFQRVDETTNTLEGLGEPTETKFVVQKILRTFPTRFNPKVSLLEEISNLTNLIIDELHGILMAYEMRIEE
eukprot:PITA_09538